MPGKQAGKSRFLPVDNPAGKRQSVLRRLSVQKGYRKLCLLSNRCIAIKQQSRQDLFANRTVIVYRRNSQVYWNILRPDEI